MTKSKSVLRRHQALNWTVFYPGVREVRFRFEHTSQCMNEFCYLCQVFLLLDKLRENVNAR